MRLLSFLAAVELFPENFWSNLVSGLVFALAGIFMLTIGYKIFDWCTPKVKWDDELSKGNVAVGIVIAAFLIGVALVIHAAIV